MGDMTASVASSAPRTAVLDHRHSRVVPSAHDTMRRYSRQTGTRVGSIHGSQRMCLTSTRPRVSLVNNEHTRRAISLQALR